MDFFCFLSNGILGIMEITLFRTGDTSWMISVLKPITCVDEIQRSYLILVCLVRNFSSKSSFVGVQLFLQGCVFRLWKFPRHFRWYFLQYTWRRLERPRHILGTSGFMIVGIARFISANRQQFLGGVRSATVGRVGYCSDIYSPPCFTVLRDSSYGLFFGII